MSGQIFISYRREESRWSARSLHDRLSARFDRNQIFMDIDAIAPGDDFINVIEKTVGECDVLIAVIGSHWLTCVDEQGGRRLDNPEDFVRREIATALKRDIRVIPVLVDRASMPRSTDLPDDLKPLVRRNALEITDTGFDDDCRRLGVAIEEVLEKHKRERPERRENKRSEAECRETEGKEHPAADAEQKVERKPPGKRKPRFVAAMMLWLALAFVLAIGAAVYFGFLRPGPSPTVLGTAYWRTCYGMTASEYKRISEELKRQAFRLTDLTGYSVGGQARYAAIWEKRDGPPWEAPFGLTSAQYQQTFEDLRMRGYRPLRISAYSIEGQAFFAGVWEQRTGPAWEVRREMAAAEFQQMSDKLKGKGYRLTDVSGYSVGGQARYAAIWEKGDGPPLEAPYGLTSAQYQQTFEDLRTRGYRPLRISAYSIEGHAFYAGVWEQSTGPAWDARREMAAAEFQRVCDELKSKGYRLTDVSGYDVGGQDRYAAIWEKNI